MLQNESSLAIGGLDTAENGPALGGGRLLRALLQKQDVAGARAVKYSFQGLYLMYLMYLIGQKIRSKFCKIPGNLLKF